MILDEKEKLAELTDRDPENVEFLEDHHAHMLRMIVTPHSPMYRRDVETVQDEGWRYVNMKKQPQGDSYVLFIRDE